MNELVDKNKADEFNLGQVDNFTEKELLRRTARSEFDDANRHVISQEDLEAEFDKL